MRKLQHQIFGRLGLDHAEVVSAHLVSAQNDAVVRACSTVTRPASSRLEQISHNAFTIMVCD